MVALAIAAEYMIPSRVFPNREEYEVMKRCGVAACWIALISSAPAKEGMFTPDQLPEMARDLRQTGLQLDPVELTDLTGFPMSAVISLGNCTASFVSPRGLVLTNHHCARGSVQFNSTQENNLLEKGFLAPDLQSELPAAPGSRVYVTVGVKDVTPQVTSDLTGSLSGRDRYERIQRKRKELIAECESDPGHRCQVSSFYGGLQYKLIKRLEIRDVRLVYAPADAIGRYGGDIDNWQWPRHTGDFAVYRVYVGPDGKAEDHARIGSDAARPCGLSICLPPSTGRDRGAIRLTRMPTPRCASLTAGSWAAHPGMG